MLRSNRDGGTARRRSVASDGGGGASLGFNFFSSLNGFPAS